MAAFLTPALGPIAGWLVDKLTGNKLENWVRLLLSCWFSWVVSTLGVTGLVLCADGTWKAAIGGGLLSGAVCLLALLLRHPQGKSLWLVVPGSIVEKYQEGGNTTIQGAKK